ncbi:MAG: ABC transporter ATP-binding protein/permease [Oscillospiraceae bacterium]|jgi:ABC-type lipoprotein export system ATPase subunit|nr:ABC transporter ATP-binding protein/permease [Oscillospiraceae bacterium]
MLSINHLSVTYGKREILKDVSADFPTGSVSVIRGKSGSGKTSLLNVLGLMQSAKDFSYTYKNENVAAFSETQKSEFRLRHIGFVFQRSNLLENLSVKNNLLIPMLAAGISEQAASARADELLSFVGLSELSGDFPDTLSGGEEQRLAVARAMANDADIILADEPTAALDNENTSDVLALLQRLAHEMGKAVIIVSHDDKVAEHADLLYEIREQGLAASGEANKGAAVSEKKLTLPQKGRFRRFIRFYNSKRIGDKWLQRVFTLITAAVTAFVILTVSIYGNLKLKMASLEDVVTHKAIYLVNSNLDNGYSAEDGGGYFVSQDGENYPSIAQDKINLIKAIEGVETVFPRYSLVSWSDDAGFFLGIDPEHKYNFYMEPPGEASLILRDDNGNTLFEKEFPKDLGDEWTGMDFHHYGVEALYPGLNITPALEYGEISDEQEALYITTTLAMQMTQDPRETIGKELIMRVLVPTKSYRTDRLGAYNGDASVYKLIEVTGIIRGVIGDFYESRLTANFCAPYLVYMPYKRFSGIIEANKDMNLLRYTEPSQATEIELMPSALMIFASDYSLVPEIAEKLRNLWPGFLVSYDIGDNAQLQLFIDEIESGYITAAVSLVAAVVVLFGFVYFLRSRTRKKEIGILKAMGLSKQRVVLLTLDNIIKSALGAFLGSVVFALVAQTISNGAEFTQAWFNIGALSIAVGFAVSVLVTVAAGIFPIISASRVDPVEAIRRINK